MLETRPVSPVQIRVYIIKPMANICYCFATGYRLSDFKNGIFNIDTVRVSGA